MVKELNLNRAHACDNRPCDVKKGSFGCKFQKEDDFYILWMNESSESCPPALDAKGGQIWQAKSVRKN